MNTVEVTIEGVTFKVAPTPLAKLAASRKAMSAFGSKEWSEEGVAALIEAVFWGARRAGSEITLEWLQTNVDMMNFMPLFDSFLEVNGLKKRTADAIPGEAAAGPDPANPTS